MTLAAPTRSPAPPHAPSALPVRARRRAGARTPASTWRFGVACRDARQAEGIRAEIVRSMGLDAHPAEVTVTRSGVAAPMLAALMLLAALALGLWWPVQMSDASLAWPSAAPWTTGDGPVGTAGAVVLALSMLGHVTRSGWPHVRHAWRQWRFDRHVQDLCHQGKVVLTLDEVDINQHAALLPLLTVHGERWWGLESRVSSAH